MSGKGQQKSCSLLNSLFEYKRLTQIVLRNNVKNKKRNTNNGLLNTDIISTAMTTVIGDFSPSVSRGDGHLGSFKR